MKQFLVFDYETLSEAPLRKVGGYEYARHKSTRILCVAWKYVTKDKSVVQRGPTECWSPAFPGAYGQLKRALIDPDITLVAHNAFFEQVITRFVLSKLIHHPALLSIPPERFICTAALAASQSLPRKLEGAAAALGLTHQKDMEGHKLVLKYCKPRKPTKKDPSLWHRKASDLRRIMEYCKKDVDAETELFLRLPPLIPIERKIWVMNQKMNWRGFYVDRPLIEASLKLIDEESNFLDAEAKDISGGDFVSARQRDGVLAWLEAEGVYLPNLKAKTVKDAIEDGVVDGEAKRICEIRQAISKSSTAKYISAQGRSSSDSRIRDFLFYYAAHTGRDSGAGFNPQNFPRGIIKDINLAASFLLKGDLELIRLLYGDPMEVLSSCLRGVIKASPGKKLFCADYNAIEARVLFWLAKHEAGIQAFLDGVDNYVKLAAVIFGIPESEVTSDQRFVGKQAFLGCGYGMGWKKFMVTCDNLGHPVDEKIAQRAIPAYRDTHWPVVDLWGLFGRVAMLTVARKHRRFKVARTEWFMRGKDLICTLPSGRSMIYPGAEIRYEMTPWEEKAPVLYYWGVSSYTRKWELQKTYGGKLTENVVQAVSRDKMKAAELDLEEAGYEVMLPVHDELLSERASGTGGLAHYIAIMENAGLAWSKGCPIKVAGWEGQRYKK